MLNDSFGDGSELESYLAEREWLLRWKARNDQDAVQEARIKVWQTTVAQPTATHAYLDQAASWRIASHLQGKPPTGWTGTDGMRARDPLTRADRASVGLDHSLLDSLEYSEALEQAHLAYHHGEILDALNALPAAQRHYVYLRFWDGMSRADIMAEMNIERWDAERLWKAAVKNLGAALAHLAVV